MITIEELRRREQEEQNKWDAFRYSDLATGNEPENYKEYRYNKWLMDTVAEYILSGKYAEDKKKLQAKQIRTICDRGDIMDATMLKNIYPTLKKYGFENCTIQGDSYGSLDIVVPLTNLVNILEDFDKTEISKIYTENDL